MPFCVWGKILRKQSQNCCSEQQIQLTDGLFYHVNFPWLSSQWRQIFGICSEVCFFNWLKYKCPELSSTIFSHHLWSWRSIAAYCSSTVPKWILPYLHFFIRVGAHMTSLSGVCECLPVLVHSPVDPWGGEVTGVWFVLNAVNSFAFSSDFNFLVWDFFILN